MHPEYMTLSRARTGERITVHFNTALDIIQGYHRQQEFMSTLGQEDYWKKNRLTLWRDLKAIQTHGEHSVFYLQFVNSEQLLPQIRWNLVDHYQKVYRDREETQCNLYYSRDIHHWGKHNRSSDKHPRVFRADIKHLQIAHSQRVEFEGELRALFEKYNCQDLDQELSGKQYFNPIALASRYVSMYYKIKEQ